MAKESFIQGKLHEYVNARGIDMPFYGRGSKITEEAAELVEALHACRRDHSAENLAHLKEEVADLILVAAVVAQQFDFTAEEALEAKIAKDSGRGAKRT